MKKSVLFAFIFVSFVCFAQSEWQWAYDIDFNGEDVADKLCVDNEGSIYAIVRFENDTLVIENDTLLTTEGVPQTSFIIKLNNSGNLQWVRHLNSSYFANCGALCVDNGGNVYVSGTFGGNLYISDMVFTSLGESNFFIVKFDGNGDILNFFRYQESGSGGLKYMCVNNENEICMFGDHYRSFTLGGFELTQNPESDGIPDLFVAKADSEGNILWANNICGNGPEFPYNIACDNNGNIYTVGKFSSSEISFGDITLTNSVSDLSTFDLFVARYNSDGSLNWAEKLGGTGDETGHDIIVDYEDNIYVAGDFSGSNFVFNDTVLAGGAACMNTFVIKFDSTFARIWGKSFGLQGNNGARCIASDLNGNAFLSGTFANSINIENFSVTSNGAVDVFVAELNKNGEITDLFNVGGDNSDFPTNIVVDPYGNYILDGYFYSSLVEFDDNSISNNSAGYADFFIAKQGQFTNRNITNTGITNNIFPNPATTSFSIKSEFPNADVEIFDMRGKQIKHINRYSGEEINVNDFSKGIYIVKLTNINGTSFEKLVVE